MLDPEERERALALRALREERRSMRRRRPDVEPAVVQRPGHGRRRRGLRRERDSDVASKRRVGRVVARAREEPLDRGVEGDVDLGAAHDDGVDFDEDVGHDGHAGAVEIATKRDVRDLSLGETHAFDREAVALLQLARRHSPHLDERRRRLSFAAGEQRERHYREGRAKGAWPEAAHPLSYRPAPHPK